MDAALGVRGKHVQSCGVVWCEHISHAYYGWFSDERTSPERPHPQLLKTKRPSQDATAVMPGAWALPGPGKAASQSKLETSVFQVITPSPLRSFIA
mmetsp:Transcript_92705/g.271392  ORF Transcript_92705/g.271392 Transcript_92705/m.271392 type:complete len:96 (+) Transcript_92705:205-492(+)